VRATRNRKQGAGKGVSVTDKTEVIE
jgi:hypothetical protein